MRLGVLICVYNQERFIGPAIEQFLPHVEEFAIYVNQEPWAGDPEPPDRTVALVQQHFVKMESPRVSLYCEDWPSEESHRNRGLWKLQGCDYVWVVDADEYYTTADILSILDQLEGRAAAYVIPQKIYWKTPEYRQDPTDTWTPPILLDPRRAFFARFRAINLGLEDCVRLSGVMLHHFSYVRTDAEMESKLNHNSHAAEVRPEWHEVWRTWQPGDEQNILPYKGAPRRALYDPAPVEITERFFRWQEKLR